MSDSANTPDPTPILPSLSDDDIRKKVQGSLAGILVRLNDQGGNSQLLCAYIVQALLASPELMKEMTKAADSCALTNIVLSSSTGQAAANPDNTGSNADVKGSLIGIGMDALNALVGWGLSIPNSGNGAVTNYQFGLISLLAHETQHCLNRAYGDKTVNVVTAEQTLDSFAKSASGGDFTKALNDYVNVRINDEISAYGTGWNTDIQLRNELPRMSKTYDNFLYEDNFRQSNINKNLADDGYTGSPIQAPVPGYNGIVSFNPGSSLGTSNAASEGTIVRYEAPSNSIFNYEANDYFDAIQIAWNNLSVTSPGGAQINVDFSKLAMQANKVGTFTGDSKSGSFIDKLASYLAGQHWSTDHPVAIHDSSANVTYVFSQPGAGVSVKGAVTNKTSIVVTEYAGSVDLGKLPTSFIVSGIFQQAPTDSVNFQQPNSAPKNAPTCTVTMKSGVSASLSLNVNLNLGPNVDPSSDPFRVIAGSDLQDPNSPEATDLAVVVKNSDTSDTLLIDTSSGSLSVAGATLGAGLVEAGTNTWTGNGVTYQFTPGSAQDTNVGTMEITGDAVGAGDSITLEGFDLSIAKTDPNGFLGIKIPSKLTITAGGPVAGSSANSGNPTPATVISGQLQTFSVSLAAPAAVAETLTISLSGTGASGFALDPGNGSPLIPLGGTIQVTIAAGQESATFALVNTADLTQASQLTLTASLTDGHGNVLTTSNLDFDYQPQTPDPFVDPVITSTIAGTSQSGNYTSFAGDGQNDAINAGAGGPNAIDLGGGNDIVNDTSSGDVIGSFVTLSGGSGGGGTPTLTGYTGDDGSSVINLHNNNDAVVAGQGDNRIYGNTEVSLTTAIQQANAGGASGAQGAFLGAGDGDNTIVGSKGNDLIMVGSGNNVIVAGPGNETILGGLELESAQSNWSVLETDVIFTDHVEWVAGYYDGSSSAPYEGNSDTSGDPDGYGDDTVFGGSGSSQIELTNGNNYADLGTGNSSLWGGMGDNTIFGGSGNVLVVGGGGNDYIQGGSGADTLAGRGGDNTIIGGAGSAFIYAGSSDDSSDPNGQWSTAETGCNLVEAGSGNDEIYGAGGRDTLMGGSGEDSIYAGAGSESIVGGSGDDVIAGGKGSDTIIAGDGAATIVGSTVSGSSLIVFGGDGSDLITGGSGNDTLYSGDGGTDSLATQVSANPTDASANTTIYGGSGDNELFGGAGNALIYGGDGTTQILAGSGATTIYGGGGFETIGGGSGTDVIYAGDGGDFVAAGNGQATIYGGAVASILADILSGSDLIVSADGDDTLFGIGNDTLVAGTGDDMLAGGGSNVTYEFNQGFGDDTITGITGISGSTANIVFGPGMAASDFTVGLGEDDDGNWGLVISGDGGTVTLDDGIMPGGEAGTITFLDPETPTFDQFVRQSGVDGDVAEANGNLIFNVDDGQRITAGINGNDTVSAWGNNDTLAGGYFSAALIVGGDNSFVLGEAYGDILGASGNNDTLQAAGYDDLIIVANASTVVEAPFETSDTVQSSVSFVLPEYVQVLELTGSSNLVATGNGEADTIIGNDGNDTLVAGTGLATLIGVSGSDTFVVTNSDDVVETTDTAAGSNYIIESSASYTLQQTFDTLILTGNGLVGTGNDDATNLIVANSGDDTLIAGSGANTADTLIAGSGNDSLVADSLVGGGGADTLIAGSGNDTLVAGTGTDVFVGGSGQATYVFNSGFGNTLIELGSGQQTIALEGGITAANVGITSALVNGMQVLELDVGTHVIDLAGDNYNDVQLAFSDGSTVGMTQLIEQDNVTATIAGASGNLILDGGNGDSVAGGTGDDTILAFGSNDTLTAGSGDQLIEASGDNSLITGGAGKDTLEAFGQAATLAGGGGNTLFIVNNSSDVVQESSSTANDTVESSVDFVLPTNVNTLVLTGSADLSGTANDGNDLIVGNAGNDLLTAGAGNDTLVAGSGLATMIGGSGGTVFVVNNVGDAVQEGSGASTVSSSVSYVLADGIDTLVLTGSADLTGTGNDDSNVITANSGNDTLVAGSGAATLIGGSGNDTFVVNSVADVIQDSSASSSNVVESSVNFTLQTNLDTLILTGTASVTGTGNTDAANLIIGNAGNDTLIAGTGADTLVAGTNSLATTLIGGSGSDTFVVNNMSDVVQEGYSNTGSVIEASVNYTLVGGVDTLILTGSSSLVGTGNADATNLIEGNAGNDTLVAGSRADTLVAGAGLATLIGGTGSDTFVVNNSADVVVAGSRNSTIYSSDDFVLPTNVDVLVLTGDSGLTATANSDNDLIVANSGDDVLIDGGGIDTLVGGSGYDIFVVSNSSDAVLAQAGNLGAVIESSVNDTLVANVGILELTGSDSLVASAGNFSGELIGNDGSDTLEAGTGDVTMVGGSGNDTFVAGSGNDLIVAGFGVNSYVFGADTGQDEISGIQSADSIMFGSGIAPNNLSVTATVGSDGLLDFAIDEGGGSIVIDGGLTQMSAVNIDYADSGTSTLSQLLAAKGGVVTVNTATGNLVIAAVDNESVSVSGGSGIDTLAAAGTNDTLQAGSGSELMLGGAGQTVFVVGTGDDADDVIEAGSDSGGGNTYVVNQGFGNVSITGGSIADTLAFGTGISLTDLSVTAAFDTNGSPVLVISDGTSTITLADDMSPEQLGNVTFADGPSVSLLQLIEQQGVPATLPNGDGTSTVFAIGNGLSYTGGDVFSSIFVYGDNATLTSVDNGSQLAAYGDNELLIGSFSTGASDVLTALGSNDTLEGGTGEELLVGGSGNDLFIVNSVDTNIENATATDTVESYKSYAMDPGVDNLIVIGSANVTITGNDDVSNVITSNSASDVIYANAENTTIEGGFYQVIYGGDGASLIDYAGGGGSTIYGGAGDVVVDDNSGFHGNTIYVGSGNSSLTLIGGSQDALIAGTGNDTLQGSNETTYEFGPGFGNDLVLGSNSGSTIVFAGGISLAALTLSAALEPDGTADLVMSDGTGSITVEGALSESIGLVSFAYSPYSQNYGEQQFIEQFGPGYQSIAGADGNFLFDSSDNASVVGGSGSDTISAWGDNDTLVAGSSGTVINAEGDYTLATGGTGADSLTANGSNDTLVGGSGADTLVANGDNANLIAGSGPEAFVVNNGSAVIQGGTRQDSIFASVDYSLLDNLQFMELVGAGITGMGNDQNDTLVAAGDDDNLLADTGSDVLIGQGSGDTLRGGSGVDTLVAGGDGFLEGSNQATYVLNAGIGQAEVLAQGSGGIIELAGLSAAQVTVGGAIGNDGTGALQITDNAGDVFTIEDAFSSGASAFQFGGGPDQSLAQFLEEVSITSTTLAGANGNLVFSGNAGDSITGGNGNDTIVGLGNNDTLVAYAGSLAGASQIFGMGADELLVGGTGSDSIYGGSGDDTLIAGYGFNTLFGGGGNDAYELTAGGTTEIDPGYTAGSESLYLPSGASISDFGAYQSGNSLVITSNDDLTTVTIDNYFSDPEKTWFLLSDSQAPVLLNSWLASIPGWGTNSYTSLISNLKNTAEKRLAMELQVLGQPGGSMDGDIDPRFSSWENYLGLPDSYTFEGVSTQDVSAQGGEVLVLDSSESDNDQTVVETEHVVVAIPGSGGDPIYQLDSSAPQQYMEYGTSVALPPGATAEPIEDGFGNFIGYLVTVPGVAHEVQIGTTPSTIPTYVDETITIPEEIVSSRSFTEYNVVGDDGNDIIVEGTFDGETNVKPFVGTVKTGNGNSYIDLGGAGNGADDGVDGFFPGTNVPFPSGIGLGAFIQVGNGNNTIVGTYGNDTIAVGTGFNSIDGGDGGDTYYLPLTAGSTDIIDDSGVPDVSSLMEGATFTYFDGVTYFSQGPGAIPMDKLVLPTGITPQNLKYREFTPDPANPGQHTLELIYGSSTVLITFSDPPPTSTPYFHDADGVVFFVNEDGTPTYDDFGTYHVGAMTTSARQGVDLFQFADGTILTLDQLLAQATALPNDFDPNVAVRNPTPVLLAGSTVAASSLFSASDTADNPISWYQISNSGDGYFILDGQVQAAGSTFDVSAAQLSSLQYVAGSDGSDDQISIGAFDGAAWSYGSVDVTAQAQTYFAATASNQLVDCSNLGYADTLVGGYSHDTLVGGTGTNTFVVSSTTVVIQDAPNGGADSLLSSVSFVLPANVDTLILTANNKLGTANSDNDTLIATGTGDTLAGGATTASNDLFIVDSATDVVTLAITHGVDTIESSASYLLTSATRVADLVLTGAADLMATGNGLSNVLVANSGNDTLVASGTTSDTLVGGSGNDLFVVNSTSDVVSLGSVYGADTIDSSVSYTLVGGVDTLVLTANNKLGTANSDNDTLIATGTGDTLTGGATTASNDLFIVNSATDVVTLAITHGVDTIESSASYLLTSATRVADLVLTGTADLMATGNGLSNVLVANSGNDTLVASGTTSDTLVGGSGNDLFVINSTSDVISLGSAYGADTIESSVSSTLVGGVDTLILTGSNTKGTANSDNDTLIATGGTGDTLAGGTTATSNDLFIVDNATDVVSLGNVHGIDTVESSVSYSLANAGRVADLVLTGTADLMATGNGATNVLVANSGNDTLVASGASDTLVGGSGNDLFVISNTSEVVQVGSVYGVDTISSSVTFSLTNAANVNILELTGASLSGTANSGFDLLKAQSTADTLRGGAGVDVLEGGTGSNVLLDSIVGGSGALIGGSGGNTLTGGAGNDFYAAGTGGAAITTGASKNIIAANLGSGAVTIAPKSGASDVLSLGGGIDTESLSFSKTGNNLVLSDGQGDTITFTNWYSSSANQNITTLQVIEQGSASYNSSSSDPLHSNPIQEFNMASLVSQFNAALAANPSLTSWNLSAGMPSAALTSSATSAYGGDLAYYYGLNGTLAGLDLSDADSILQNSAFGSGLQSISTGNTGGITVLAQPAAEGEGAAHTAAQPAVLDTTATTDGSSNPAANSASQSSASNASTLTTSTGVTITPGGISLPVVTPPIFGQQTGTGTSTGTGSGSSGSSGQQNNTDDSSFQDWLQSLLNQNQPAARKGGGATPFTGTLDSGGGPTPAPSLSDIMGSSDNNGFVTSDAMRSAMGTDVSKQVDAGLFADVDSPDRKSNASQWSLANDASADSLRSIRSAKVGSGAEEEIAEDSVGLDFLPSSIHHRMLQHKAQTSVERSSQ